VLTSAYRSEAYLPHFFEQIQAQSIFAQLELVLVLNEASFQERKLAQDFADKLAGRVQLIEVSPVETLGASWNRAWRAARAPLLALWNVDDRRLSDSLERQVAALEAHPDWVTCYGDYLAVDEYGQESGKRRHTPHYAPSAFRRAFPQGGAFWVYRKTLAEQLGYFDEQFRVGPDLDLSIRIAAGGYQMGRVDGVLGYFTDAQEGLSTRDGAARSAVERTAVQLRYGIFDKVRSELVEGGQGFHLDQVLSFGEWHPIETYLPGYQGYIRRRQWLKWVGRLRNATRRLFRKLGILDWLYGLQDRYLKREI
jgi:hypothetical protein